MQKTIKMLNNTKSHEEGGLRLRDLKNCLCAPPQISILTIVLNDYEYIEETIKSVLTQGFESFEYIIIDGGSTDGTLDKVRAYDDKIDYWLSESDNGVYDAMNKGIAQCKGEIVKIINSGDTLAAGAIEKVMETYRSVNNNTTIVVRSFLNLTDLSGGVIDMIDDISISRFYPNILHPSWYVPRQIYDSVGLYNTSYAVASDYEYFQRLKNHNVSFETIQEPLVNFRIGGVSGSGLRGQNEVFRINCRNNGLLVALYVYSLNVGARVKNCIVKLWRAISS